MRRFVCLCAALVLCLSMACPAFAVEGEFVPSIGYKDGPDIEDAEMNGEDVGNCVIVTSIKEAEEKTTDIYQEDRDLLLEVYEELDEGTMTLPLEEDYVIRELVDVSFAKEGCVENEHGHKEWLAEEDTSITITFDLGVNESTEVTVLVYIDGEWILIENVVNNGDGTITVEFEDFCPVAFCVEPGADTEPPKTGDAVGANLMLWIVLLAVSMTGILVLVANRRKFLR